MLSTKDVSTFRKEFLYKDFLLTDNFTYSINPKKAKLRLVDIKEDYLVFLDRESGSHSLKEMSKISKKDYLEFLRNNVIPEQSSQDLPELPEMIIVRHVGSNYQIITPDAEYTVSELPLEYQNGFIKELPLESFYLTSELGTKDSYIRSSLNFSDLYAVPVDMHKPICSIIKMRDSLPEYLCVDMNDLDASKDLAFKSSVLLPYISVVSKPLQLYRRSQSEE